MTQATPVWDLKGPIFLVGAGKMGNALLSGWVANGVPPANILVQEPSPTAETTQWCLTNGVSLEPCQTLPLAAAVLIMAVKPQMMADIFPALAKHTSPHTITLSIAAGKTLSSCEQHLPANASVIRAMPNTPAAIGRGMTVLCPNAHVTTVQRALCQQLMSAVGEVGWVDDEALMDVVTAVSGSGPAYVFILAEALAQAGVEAGLEPALAMHLARATIAGSGELMHRSVETAAALRANVTSPGGTTAAALDVLMATDGLAPLMARAVAAAVARGRTLGN